MAPNVANRRETHTEGNIAFGQKRNEIRDIPPWTCRNQKHPQRHTGQKTPQPASLKPPIRNTNASVSAGRTKNWDSTPIRGALGFLTTR